MITKKNREPKPFQEKMTLPTDLLSLHILPHLPLSSALMCSAACKSWKSALANATIDCCCAVSDGRSLAALRRVSVTRLEVVATAEVARLLPGCSTRSLRSLQMWVEGFNGSVVFRSAMDDITAELVLRALGGVARRLEELSLGNVADGGALAGVLRSMGALRRLKLAFVYFPNGDDGAAWDAISRMGALDSLSLLSLYAPTGLKALPPNLRRLTLHRVGMTPAGARTLFDASPPTLAEVDIHAWASDAAHDDPGVTRFPSPLRLGPGLAVLRIEGVDLVPTELRALLRSPLPRTVQRLLLACNRLCGLRLALNDEGPPHRLPPFLDLSHNNLLPSDLTGAIVPYCLGSHHLTLDGNHHLFGMPNPTAEYVRLLVAGGRFRGSVTGCGWDRVHAGRHVFPELVALMRAAV